MSTPTPSEFINAQILRLGFFDGSKQYFHICSIKIINSNDVDISKSCKFSQTTPKPPANETLTQQSQSAGQLKDILVDLESKSFCHTTNDTNQYLVIDFLKMVSIKQIIIENRNESNGIRDRIINAQFKLYDAADKIVYESSKIKVGNQFYYINGTEKTFNDASKIYTGDVISGQPSTVTIPKDPNDPCNDKTLMKSKPNLASACACKTASDEYSDQVKRYNTAKEQYEIDRQYYEQVGDKSKQRKEYDDKSGFYAKWAVKLAELQNEQKPFKSCLGKSGYSAAEWAYVCEKDHGVGWEYVSGSDFGYWGECGLYSKGMCRRSKVQAISELNSLPGNLSYNLWSPPNYPEPKQVTAPASTPITCCSQTFDNITAGGKVNISGISQNCSTQITNQINSAAGVGATPPTTPPTTPPPTTTPLSKEAIIGIAAVAIIVIVGGGILYSVLNTKQTTN